MLVAVIGISALGYFWGRNSIRSKVEPGRFRIVGDSMAPTLTAGEVCEWRPISAELEIGDVVAVEWLGKQRVKRVAALPGDLVELERGRLLVNQQRLEDLLAARTHQDSIPPALVPVAATEQDWIEIRGGQEFFPGRCWVFAYHNPHAGRRITPIMDDYPVNVSVKRTLHPVDRLVVSIQFPQGHGEFDRSKDDPPSPTLAVFYHSDFDHSERSFRFATLNQGRATSREATHLAPLDEAQISALQAAMDSNHQIAILHSGQTRPQITVHREIEYRDDRKQAHRNYPRQIGPAEVFLVGDNVPVSVDSRQWGPIPLRAIIARLHKKGSGAFLVD